MGKCCHNLFGFFVVVDDFVCVWLKGFLDGQFVQLQMLRDDSNPDFVMEVVILFFEDSQRILNELSKTLSELPLYYF